MAKIKWINQRVEIVTNTGHNLNYLQYLSPVEISITYYSYLIILKSGESSVTLLGIKCFDVKNIYGYALFVKNEDNCKKNLNCNACWETCGMIHENFEIWGSLCSFPTICLPGCRTACKFLSNSSFPSKNDELMPLTVKSKFDLSAMRFTLEWIPQYNRLNSTVLYTVLIHDEGLEWQQIAQTVSHIVHVKGYMMDRTTSIRVLAANTTHRIAFVETNYVKSSILSTEKPVYVNEENWSPQLVSMVWSDTSTGILATITWPTIPDELDPNEYEVSWNALGDPMEVTGHLQTSKNTVVLTLWPDSIYLVTVDRYTSSDIVYGDTSQTLIINTKDAVNQTTSETKSLEDEFPSNKDPVIIIIGKICLCMIGTIFLYMTIVGLIHISRWIQKATNKILHRKKNTNRMHLLLKKNKVLHQEQEKYIEVINPSMLGIHFKTKTSDAPSLCTLHV
ncbi:uncharacterized protein TNCT_201871 [Trichonephila clavata]|uniref:Uncharacterized protein n=1 Tax=Trichonephila clavata TaxID=2740835 RepID=A0A8X6GY55_TRICU|nr:uncharacterized protein TNCT_201871 [Trichonephila clavata]